MDGLSLHLRSQGVQAIHLIVPMVQVDCRMTSLGIHIDRTTMSSLLSLAAAALAAGPSTLFPPGWNGLASLPPMGWSVFPPRSPSDQWSMSLAIDHTLPTSKVHP